MKIEKLVATKADLAFIDAAIDMHRASQLRTNTAMVGVDASSPIACDPVDVAALVVAAAVIAYKAYNSCLVGDTNEIVERAERLNIAPTVSLGALIESRNKLAAALNEPALARNARSSE